MPGRSLRTPVSENSVHARARGSMTKSCGVPVLIATARVKRSCAAMSLAAPCRRAPRRPPPKADAASSVAAAISTSTTSISSSVKPAGRPRILGEALDLCDALVAAWLPGTEGAGIADVLFGTQKPTGHLPVSWPRTMAQIPINIGDANYDPLFPFGFGLSYSQSVEKTR